MSTIRNPLELGWEALGQSGRWLGEALRVVSGQKQPTDTDAVVVQRFTPGDLRGVLAAGVNDMLALRSDVIALCLVYPAVGVALAAFAFNQALVPLLFPIAAGFALVAPFFMTGVYEVSRRRDSGHDAGWRHAFDVFASPSFGAILVIGAMLFALFGVWLAFADGLYALTIGRDGPETLPALAEDVATTPEGWALAVIGIGTGFLFALFALATVAVSIPLLLDRDVGLRTGIRTSWLVFRRNPRAMLAWGGIVAGGLVLGSLPAFLGLIFVLPVLGHATWHLYRRAVAVRGRGPGA